MFSLPGEVEQSSYKHGCIQQLRQYIEKYPSLSQPPKLPTSLDFTLNVTVDPEHAFQLHIQLPLSRPDSLTHEQNEDLEEPPPPIVLFRCPTWMSRKAHSELVQRMPSGSPDAVLETVDYLKQECSLYLSGPPTSASPSRRQQSHSPNRGLVRVWFYLQSLSTRSKRDDMVNWASSYKLTGVVLAGKPGILCLEGHPEDIDAYMSEIKTRSWSDVPSHQKKISERFREDGPDVKRVFDDMREVTGDISKGGHRGNRGEMGEVRALFDKVGLGDVFAEVLGL
ncbi:uncharacterized protein EI97DRAFT_376255 [Westerdykella ornata]|uniref:Small nuclear ribonucleoprotein Prp3 C-terminal domain-containing protein n=1 Tax=Westerdykella ornata TaxID=318751 RepID=A0A6A6JKK9_WESOR|nr:uncharacterized protein EI97DRAFT_376255 [Westerdykella ornata]KAF2276794.1 hypothetical protein EI97DRAFT_376255 [Westerdykella ornata]